MQSWHLVKILEKIKPPYCCAGLVIDASLAYSLSLILSTTTFNRIFWEKTYAFDSSDITQAQAGRRKGHGGCQWRTGMLLTIGVVGLGYFCCFWGRYFKENSSSWLKEIFTHKTYTSSRVSVTCHGVTLHIGIGELQIVDVEKGLLVGSGHENHSLLSLPGSLFLFFFHTTEWLIRTVTSFVEVYVFPCWTSLIGCSISRDFNFLVSPSVQDTISRTQLEDSAEGAPWWLLLNQSHIMSW